MDLLRRPVPPASRSGPDARRSTGCASSRARARSRSSSAPRAWPAWPSRRPCAPPSPASSSTSSTRVAKFVYYRNGAQGEAYYSLIASAGERLVPALQRGQAADEGRRAAALRFRARRRLLHERHHADVAGQRPLQPLAARAVRLLPRLLSRDPEGHPPRADARRPSCRRPRPEMERLLAATRFSKPEYERAAREFVTTLQAAAAGRAVPARPLGGNGHPRRRRRRGPAPAGDGLHHRARAARARRSRSTSAWRTSS